jgi:hypothetical protein
LLDGGKELEKGENEKAALLFAQGFVQIAAGKETAQAPVEVYKLAKEGKYEVEFPRKSGHEVKGYPARSYSAGER